MHAERRDQNGRQQHHMEHEQAGDHVNTGEFAAEQQPGDPCADDGDRLHHAIDDAQTIAGQQIVGERVAGEPLGHREDKKHKSDEPVDFARLAESAGEEDAQHVQPDGGDEQQSCPVVHLAHQQTATDVERYVEA